MAYLAFDFAGEAPHAPAAIAGPTGFTATEWAVIRLARIDPIATVRPPSTLGGLMRRLFGLPAANRLADPRLEALRQAAVRCRHGRALDVGQMEALLAHGFRFEQIASLFADEPVRVR